MIPTAKKDRKEAKNKKFWERERKRETTKTPLINELF